MTQQQRDTMVERYLDGTMSPAERRDFLNLLDGDEMMRRTLYAETLINKSVRHERMAMPSPSAASRARFMTMLATVAPEPGASIAGSDGGAGVAGKGASAARGIAGSSAAKAIVTTLTGIAVTIGAVVVIPRLTESSRTERSAPPAVVQPQSSPTAPAVTGPAAEPAPQINAETPRQESPVLPAEVQTEQPAKASAVRQRPADPPAQQREEPRLTRRSAKPADTKAGATEPSAQRPEQGGVVNDPAKARGRVKPPIVN